MRKISMYTDFNHIKSNETKKPEVLQKRKLKTATLQVTL